jgi:hypothetical protein
MKRPVLVGIIIVIIGVAAVLITPVALAGNFTVKVTKVSFTENNSGTAITFSQGLTSNGTTTPSAYEYYFALRSGGAITSNNNNVNSTAGSTNTTITWRLYNSSNQTISQGTYLFSGGLGNRTHTFTFAVDQGVRDSGLYRLFMFEQAAAIKAPSTSVHNLAQTTQYTWKVQ